MPIDARIPLMGERVNIQPFDLPQTLNQIAQYKQAQSGQRLNDLRLSEAERGVRQQQGVREAFGKNFGPAGLDEQGLLRDVGQQDPDTYLKLADLFSKRGKAAREEARADKELSYKGREVAVKEADAEIKDQEAAQKRALYITGTTFRLASGVEALPPEHREAGYQKFKQMLGNYLSEGELQKVMEGLPPSYNRAKMQEIVQANMDASERLKLDIANMGRQTTERGQDITAQTAIRGQDMTAQTAKEGHRATAGKDTRALENTLADDFNQISKPFREVAAAWERIQTSAHASPAGDIALVFNFMKMIDPGSTVREGEAATVRNAAGIPDRIRATWNKLLVGETLAEGQRQDFIDRGKTLYAAAERNFSHVKTQFETKAKKQGGNPENVTMDFTAQSSEPAAPPARVTNVEPVQAPSAATLQQYKDRPLTSDFIDRQLAAARKARPNVTRAEIIEYAIMDLGMRPEEGVQ